MSRVARKPRPSGRFLLRVDPALHALLKASARELGLSLHDFCSRKLTMPVDPAAFADEGAAVVRRAVELYGPRLAGVVVFGSWARGEAADGSDVDLLVVIDRRLALTRSLYAPWDAEAATWDGRPVEVHLAHLPESGQPPSSIWAEVALDGLVVFERGRQVSVCLAAVRREIAAGRFVRRVSQGQPYWVRVA
jgi:predicted nucleotidyltransferase